MSDTTSKPATIDAVVVGAGFSGLYMLHKLRGQGLSVRVFEAADGVGGTWYWNRYPGARCDSESHYYCYSFDEAMLQEWEWTCRYPEQPEILSYLNWVADKLDLRRDIQFDTRVVSASYDEASNTWDVETDDGAHTRSTYLITAVGCLSAAQIPSIPGLDSFQGPWYHTGQWPHEGVDFGAKRVGIIGTGSSGIQAIPVIAAQAAHLTVFQRTPNFSVPARNAPLSDEAKREIKANYGEIIQKTKDSPFGFPLALGEKSALEATAEERRREYDAHWEAGGFRLLFSSYNDLILNKEANDTAADYVRAKIREIVRDPAVAERLCPKDYPIGTKRPPIDTDYFETFNRPNVALVDLNQSPIEAITASGIRTRDAEYELDAIVFATGYDAMTGSLFRLGIRGRDGVALEDKWAHGPQTYLGVSSAGFPNLFIITGPGSPSVLTNMPVAIEQHVEWIADCIAHLRAHGLDRIEPNAEAERAWVERVNEEAAATLFPQANSWYMGANIPGKPRVFFPFVGGCNVYRQHCKEIAEKGYEGFTLSRGDGRAAAAAE
ncbi:MAG: NAD(P)/FAD-dependent oxidoreductase [Alphaproteobacteria bacterium]|nr:NAD(P)/FAD-dependent oxidoreductase [Alphaproteobacteria bacterium]